MTIVFLSIYAVLISLFALLTVRMMRHAQDQLTESMARNKVLREQPCRVAIVSVNNEMAQGWARSVGMHPDSYKIVTVPSSLLGNRLPIVLMEPITGASHLFVSPGMQEVLGFMRDHRIPVVPVRY